MRLHGNLIETDTRQHQEECIKDVIDETTVLKTAFLLFIRIYITDFEMLSEITVCVISQFLPCFKMIKLFKNGRRVAFPREMEQ